MQPNVSAHMNRGFLEFDIGAVKPIPKVEPTVARVEPENKSRLEGVCARTGLPVWIDLNVANKC